MSCIRIALVAGLLALSIAVTHAAGPSSSTSSKPTSASAPTTSISVKGYLAIQAIGSYTRSAKPEDLRKFWQDAARVGLKKAATDVAQTELIEDPGTPAHRVSDNMRKCSEFGVFDEFKDVDTFRKAYVNFGLETVIPMVDFRGLELKDTLEFCQIVSGVTVEADWNAISKETPVKLQMENATVRQVLDAMIKDLSGGAKWRVDIDADGVPKIIVTAGSAVSSKPSTAASTSATATMPSVKEQRAFYAVQCYTCSVSAEEMRKFWREARDEGMVKAAGHAAATTVPVDDIFVSGGKTTATELLRHCVDEGGFDGFKNVDDFRSQYVDCYLQCEIAKVDFNNMSLGRALQVLQQSCGVPVICDLASMSKIPAITLRMQNTTIREALDRVLKEIGPEATWRLDTDEGGIPMIVVDGGKSPMRPTSDKDF